MSFGDGDFYSFFRERVAEPYKVHFHPISFQSQSVAKSPRYLPGSKTDPPDNRIQKLHYFTYRPDDNLDNLGKQPQYRLA